MSDSERPFTQEKDQIYHKLLAERLAARGLDSFRFDFRSNAESPGEWHKAKFNNDVEDLKAVVQHVEDVYKYQVYLIVGHSRGSIISFVYLAYENHKIPLYVNLSGRYRMEKVYDRLPIYKPQWDEKGYYLWKARVARQPVEVKVTPEMAKEFAEHDTSFVETRFPQATHVLNIHGTADETVPVEDASIYHGILSKRSPGTSNLRLIEGTNHNYTKKYEEVVSSITGWLDSIENQTSPQDLLASSSGTSRVSGRAKL